MPHQFGLAGTPMSSELQPQGVKQLVAQSLLVFNVFRTRNCQDHRGASRSDQIPNAHCLARTRVSDNHMPAPAVQRRTQHRLETECKGGLDEDLLVKEGMNHNSGSSHSWRIRNGRTGRSGSVSGTAFGGCATFACFASILANRSSTSAG